MDSDDESITNQSTLAFNSNSEPQAHMGNSSMHEVRYFMLGNYVYQQETSYQGSPEDPEDPENLEDIEMEYHLSSEEESEMSEEESEMSDSDVEEIYDIASNSDSSEEIAASLFVSNRSFTLGHPIVVLSAWNGQGIWLVLYVVIFFVKIVSINYFQ